LDHFLIFHEKQLIQLLRSYVLYFNQARPLCWLLETSVLKINLLYPMKEASCQSMCDASRINAVHFAPVF
jgi:hypothetical protein